MKKIHYSLIVAATVVSLISAVPVSAAAAVSDQTTSSDSGTEINVADAFMYRGIVTELYESEGITTVTLRQAEGTDFGLPALTLTISADTKLTFDSSELKEGIYLEAYYSPEKATVIQTEPAILVNKLTDANLSVYNGTVISVKPDPDNNTGDILLKNSNGTGETLFHYTEKTKCYLNFAKIKKGDKLNIYHSGMLTRSIPPQGTALEIRTTADTSLYRGTVTKVSTVKGITTLFLKRAAGSNFSKNTVQIKLAKNTKSDVKLSEIKKGMYLELFYYNSTKTPTAVSINKLFESTAVNYNGKVTEVTPDKEKEGYGSITMKDLKGNNETIFHYSPATKFNIPVADLKKDTTLNIYHKGIQTLSIPPQCISLEISAYQK